MAVRDDRIGPHDGIFTDTDRSDQNGARANLTPVADPRFALPLAIEVRRNRSRTDIHLFPDLGITQVSQMAQTVPVPRCDCLISTKAPASIPSSNSVPSRDARTARYGTLNRLDRAADDGKRVNNRIAANRYATVDVGVARVDDRHPLGHPVVLDPRLHHRRRLRQMLAGIDAQNIVGLAAIERITFRPMPFRCSGASVR